MSDTPTTTEDAQRRRLLRPTAAAEYVYGDRSEAATRRLKRAVAAGELTAMRVGGRGDFWFSTVELDRFVASAERTAEAS